MMTPEEKKEFEEIVRNELDESKNRMTIPEHITGGLAVIAGLTLACMFGPIDMVRTVYNKATGNSPALKNELVNHLRKSIRRKNPELSKEAIESQLAINLGYKDFDGCKVEPLYADITQLWDAVENDYSNSWWDRWIWTDLD